MSTTVRNNTSQLIELHLADGVVYVLPPFGDVSLEMNADSGQVRHLSEVGRISILQAVEAVAEPEPAVEAPGPAAVKKAAAKKSPAKHAPPKPGTAKSAGKKK